LFREIWLDLYSRSLKDDDAADEDMEEGVEENGRKTKRFEYKEERERVGCFVYL
jgi:hypothetical protein